MAFYIRLSISEAGVADSKKEESNSIANQRNLLSYQMIFDIISCRFARFY